MALASKATGRSLGSKDVVVIGSGVGSASDAKFIANNAQMHVFKHPDVSTCSFPPWRKVTARIALADWSSRHTSAPTYTDTGNLFVLAGN